MMKLSEDATMYLIDMAYGVRDAEDETLSVGANEIIEAYSPVSGFRSTWRPSLEAQCFLWDFYLSGVDYLSCQVEEGLDGTAELHAYLNEVHDYLDTITH